MQDLEFLKANDTQQTKHILFWALFFFEPFCSDTKHNLLFACEMERNSCVATAIIMPLPFWGVDFVLHIFSVFLTWCPILNFYFTLIIF